MAMIDMQYRITGIRSLQISTQDGTLFGKAAGESLNDYFEIIRYQPQYVISSQTNALICGEASTDFPTTIDEWLSLSPMAQPLMYLRFVSPPPELPAKINFVVEMETNAGTKILCTSNLVRIVP